MSETICIDTTIVSLHALKETFQRQFGGNKDRPERVNLTPYIILACERKGEKKGPQKVQKSLSLHGLDFHNELRMFTYSRDDGNSLA